MTDWHYQYNGETRGPVDDAQLQALAEAGVVNLATPVWKTGYPDWIPLSQSDFPFLSSVGTPVTAGAGGAALAASHLGAPGGDVVVDDLSMWGFFVRAITERYVKFTGRARRKEFWSYYLFLTILFVGVAIVVNILMFNAGGPEDPSGRNVFAIGNIVMIVMFLALFLPTLGMWVRRLHDLGFSGWLFLIYFTGIGAIVLFVMAMFPTNFGPNKHGPAPKAPKSV